MVFAVFFVQLRIADHDVCSSGHSTDGSFGVRPGATGALSALGPGGFFLPQIQMAGRASFCPPHKKRPYHLNMMRVTVIDKPRSEERVMVTHEGKQACCYVQGNAWDSPSCEDTFQEWSRTPRQPPILGRSDQCINDSSFPAPGVGHLTHRA
jgi:hypothetical protein